MTFMKMAPYLVQQRVQIVDNFFENTASKAVTANGDRFYRKIIEFVLSESINIGLLVSKGWRQVSLYKWHIGFIN